MDDEYLKFMEELGITVSMIARYGGVLTIYTDGNEVKVLYAKDVKTFDNIRKIVKENATWLNEELLTKEMLEYGKNIKVDGEQ